MDDGHFSVAQVTYSNTMLTLPYGHIHINWVLCRLLARIRKVGVQNVP